MGRGGARRRPNGRARALALLAVLAAVVAAVLVAGLAMPEGLYAPDFAQKRLAPSAEHWFGTDFLGHDMFCRSVRGLALSLVIGAFSSAVSGCVALVLGSVSAVAGGLLDRAVLWLCDLFMAIPHLVLLILVSFALGGGVAGVVVAVATTHWPSLTRLIRAEVLRIRTGEYVQASRALGLSRTGILVKHILPNCLAPIIVMTTTNLEYFTKPELERVKVVRMGRE